MTVSELPEREVVMQWKEHEEAVQGAVRKVNGCRKGNRV